MRKKDSYAIWRKKCPKWSTDTSQKRWQLGLDPKAAPWTGEGKPKLGVPACPRIQALVNTAILDRMKKTGLSVEDAAKGFFCHLDSSITMAHWGTSGILQLLFLWSAFKPFTH